MIKYEAMENKYYYDMSLLENILDLLNRENYYSINNCTQEKIGLLIEAVNNFLQSIKPVEAKVIKQRHETEEEAREYFGEDFIKQFEALLTELDKQKTILAIHGTSPYACPNICNEGLKYKSPSLNSTAVLQSMNYGQKDMKYDDYEGLLNWGHKNYKGLVLVAFPYECYYKEGIWNHFQESDHRFTGIQDYKIDPDFIAGYIDVLNKKLVLNPKYKREHNYDGYVVDFDLFREQKDMDNDKLTQILIETDNLINESLTKNNPSYENPETEYDPERIVYMTEPLLGTFNSIKIGFPEFMTEDRYKMFLNQMADEFKPIKAVFPKLKTEADVLKEQEELEKKFAAMYTSTDNNDFEFPDVWDAEDVFDDFDNDGPNLFQ